MSNVTETPITHTQAARDITLTLRQLVQGMRGYTLLTGERRRKINLAGRVEDEFLRQVAVMLEANAKLAGTVELSGDEVREHLSFYGAHEGVGDELILLGRGVKDTLLNERSVIGQKAIHAVNIAKTLTKPEDRELLMPHLDNIQKLFARGKRKKSSRLPATPEPAKPETTKAESTKAGPGSPRGVST